MYVSSAYCLAGPSYSIAIGLGPAASGEGRHFWREERVTKAMFKGIGCDDLSLLLSWEEKTPKYKMAWSPPLGRDPSNPTAWKEVPERDFQACFFMDFLLRHCSILLNQRHKRDVAKPTLVLNLTEMHPPSRWKRVRGGLRNGSSPLGQHRPVSTKVEFGPAVLFITQLLWLTTPCTHTASQPTSLLGLPK